MTTLVQVASDDIRARSRPWAVAALAAWELALGLVLGASFASVAGVYAHHPDGDAPLFAPGGLPLLDLLRHAFGARGPLVWETLTVVLVARVVGLAPHAGVLAALAFRTKSHRSPSLRDALALGGAAASASFAVEVFILVAEGGAVTFALAVAALVAPAATLKLGERGGDESLLALAALTGLAVLVVGVVGDLSRSAVVRFDARSLPALKRGVEVFAACPAGLLWSFGWRAGSAWLPVLFGALLASRLGGQGGMALFTLAAFHQVVVVVRAAIRASWMSKTLRAVAG